MTLLEAIVRHWKDEEFVGISALSLAEAFSLRHEDVLAELESLRRKRLVRLREAQLGQLRLGDLRAASRGGAYSPPEFDMVDTVIAFPTSAVLEEVFLREGKDYGVFTNKLHLGDHQHKHYFFRREVLDRYLRLADRYRVEDDSTGGRVSTRTEYYLSATDESAREDMFASVDFGNLRLKDGTHAIGVIAIDLSRLSKQEQMYWAAHEIEEPEAAEDNDDWREHIAETLEGSWDAKHIDLPQALTDVLEVLNTVIGGRLFRRTRNPRVHIPPLNTLAEYQAAHKELYKILCSDNLDQNLLKSELGREGYSDSDFMHESGRPKSPWQLFKMLCERRGVDFGRLEVVHNSRQADAHRIPGDASLPTEYYPERFKQELSALVIELKKLLLAYGPSSAL